MVASVAKIVILYAQRYSEEFGIVSSSGSDGSLLSDFIKLTWNVTTALSQSSKHDAIASLTMRFLAIVTCQQPYRQVFEDGLKILCDSVVVPNMLLREAELETFEDEPLDYVRRDLEGYVDEDSRREACFALVKGLMQFFEEQTSTLLLSYATQYLQLYTEDPAKRWREKDAALNIFTSVAVKATVSLVSQIFSNSYYILLAWCNACELGRQCGQFLYQLRTI